MSVSVSNLITLHLTSGLSERKKGVAPSKTQLLHFITLRKTVWDFDSFAIGFSYGHVTVSNCIMKGMHNGKKYGHLWYFYSNYIY